MKSRKKAIRDLFNRRNDVARNAKVECIECGGRLKVEVISQDRKWITAHCPICGNDLQLRPYRPNPTRAHREQMDRIAWSLFWTAIIMAGALLIVETVRR